MLTEKEIHFYESEHEAALNQLKPLWEQKTFYHGYMNTEQAIKHNMPNIHTLQMSLLSTSLFEKGYRIFIHETNGEVYEIKLGTNNERTNREIKKSHNLLKMWMSGEFKK